MGIAANPRGAHQAGELSLAIATSSECRPLGRPALRLEQVRWTVALAGQRPLTELLNDYQDFPRLVVLLTSALARPRHD